LKEKSALNEEQKILLGKEDTYWEELLACFVDLDKNDGDKKDSRSSSLLYL
jgi:hypothetical protein